MNSASSQVRQFIVGKVGSCLAAILLGMLVIGCAREGEIAPAEPVVEPAQATEAAVQPTAALSPTDTPFPTATPAFRGLDSIGGDEIPAGREAEVSQAIAYLTARRDWDGDGSEELLALDGESLSYGGHEAGWYFSGPAADRLNGDTPGSKMQPLFDDAGQVTTLFFASATAANQALQQAGLEAAVAEVDLDAAGSWVGYDGQGNTVARVLPTDNPEVAPWMAQAVLDVAPGAVLVEGAVALDEGGKEVAALVGDGWYALAQTTIEGLSPERDVSVLELPTRQELGEAEIKQKKTGIARVYEAYESIQSLEPMKMFGEPGSEAEYLLYGNPETGIVYLAQPLANPESPLLHAVHFEYSQDVWVDGAMQRVTMPPVLMLTTQHTVEAGRGFQGLNPKMQQVEALNRIASAYWMAVGLGVDSLANNYDRVPGKYIRPYDQLDLARTKLVELMGKVHRSRNQGGDVRMRTRASGNSYYDAAITPMVVVFEQDGLPNDWSLINRSFIADRNSGGSLGFVKEKRIGGIVHLTMLSPTYRVTSQTIPGDMPGLLLRALFTHDFFHYLGLIKEDVGEIRSSPDVTSGIIFTMCDMINLPSEPTDVFGVNALPVQVNPDVPGRTSFAGSCAFTRIGD